MSEFSNLSLVKRFDNLDVSETFEGYSGLEIILDDEHSVFAGTHYGRVLTIENPWGTKAMAERLLARLQGYQYQPYRATGALLDPAAELGDGVNINGLYGGLFEIDRQYTRLMAADISATQDEEIDHEYPFETRTDRKMARKFSAITSELNLQAGEISAKVSEEGGSRNSVAWSLKSQAWTVLANNKEVFKVDKDGATVTGRITATSGKIGGFDIGATAITYNGITMSTTNKTGVYLGQSGIRVNGSNSAYFKASSNGDVEAHNLKLTGTLYFVDGSGNQQSISANNLRLGASRANSGYSGWNSSKSWTDNAANSGKGVTYMRTKDLYVSAGAVIGSITLGGQSLSLQQKTIGGQTIAFVGWGY